MGIFRKKQPEKKSFDRDRLRPAIRSSICTGEQVAGFKDIATGKFEDIMLINSRDDLIGFMETYDIVESEIVKIY
ncbi:MAG: aspartate dehydrogenase [Oscillospiraceae bacterium]|nr:aspartate dehydrogenase [Oscillospiraceae bacterium]